MSKSAMILKNFTWKNDDGLLFSQLKTKVDIISYISQWRKIQLYLHGWLHKHNNQLRIPIAYIIEMFSFYHNKIIVKCCWILDCFIGLWCVTLKTDYKKLKVNIEQSLSVIYTIWHVISSLIPKLILLLWQNNI